MIQEQIDTLSNELKRLQSLQRDCRHSWGKPFQSTMPVRHTITENRPMGSDYFNPVTVGSSVTHVPVWKRACTVCGYTQQTTETKPVISHHEPVF
jgi:hypothetical protein